MKELNKEKAVDFIKYLCLVNTAAILFIVSVMFQPKEVVVPVNPPLPEVTVPSNNEKIGSCMSNKTCKLLAEVGYYESRSEPDEGVAGVMHVVLNRAEHDSKWPNSPQKVVAQKHQFSYRWDGSMKKGFAEKESYRRMLLIAYNVLVGEIESPVGKSNHYHTVDVKPKWRHNMRKVATIGSHVFYEGA